MSRAQAVALANGSVYEFVPDVVDVEPFPAMSC